MDNRAQVGGQAKKAVGIIVGVTVLALMAAFLAPVALNEINGDTTVTVTQNTSETVEINAELNATLDSVDTTNDSGTYILEADNQSITKTVSNGSTATFSFDRGDVNVTVNDVSTGEATADFSYPHDFPYSDGAQGLWDLVGLVLVLGILIFAIGIGLKATNRL